jgi:hypothetical protein
MKRNAALFLQVAVVLFGVGVLALMLGEPHLEGRNDHATTFEVYFHDPFLAYVYVGSIPFFVAVYRAFGLLGHVRRTGAFSQVTVDALRGIKCCAFSLLGFVTGAIVIIIGFGDEEDWSGGVFMCFLAFLATSVVAIAATMFARNLQSALR